ncbi:MAG: hypothetical protein AABZ61_05700 [Bacteroidota bacterium]
MHVGGSLAARIDPSSAMNVVVRNLKSYLQQALNGSISKKDLTDLVHLSRAIIEANLRAHRASIARLCFSQGLTVSDMAYDCIGEAFFRGSQDKFLLLENFVCSLRDSVETLPEQEIFLAYKSFITRVADAQLARLYAQTDPAGARIHRNLRDCIKHSKIFSLEKDFRGLMIKPSGEDSLDHLDSFPFEDLEKEFGQSISSRSSTMELLKTLHRLLTGQSTHRRSLSLVDVAQLFKKVYEREFEAANEALEFPEVEGLTEFEIEQLRTQVQLVLKEKILLTYLARGKGDRKEAEAMFKAFEGLLFDWCHSEDQQASLSEYLCRYLPIDGERYEKDFRVKMEYLLKIAREEFGARLMKDI